MKIESFEWDPKKDRGNFQKHGITFSEASLIFSGIVFTVKDTRKDYGELRFISIGSIAGVVVIVVAHTSRYGVTRIISARKAKEKERERYYEHLEKAAKGSYVKKRFKNRSL
jgi:uncharacterized DUF497 family protein